MSAAVLSIRDVLLNSPMETKKAVLAELLKEMMTASGGGLTPISDETGDVLGYFVGTRPTVERKPIVLSPEEEAEMRRRAATPHLSVPIEEVIEEYRAMARAERTE